MSSTVSRGDFNVTCTTIFPCIVFMQALYEHARTFVRVQAWWSGRWFCLLCSSACMMDLGSSREIFPATASRQLLHEKTSLPCPSVRNEASLELNLVAIADR